MNKYPLLFEASSHGSSGIKNTWESNALNLPKVVCAIPKEFAGPGNGYSPEDLMAMAVINCFIATFKVFSEKAQLIFDTIDGKGTIVIDRLNTGFVGVSKVNLEFTVTNSSDPTKAEVILKETQKNCLMANALKAEVQFSFSIV
jgi:organic hydroperoxide reductase OsmC/OhrA